MIELSRIQSLRRVRLPDAGEAFGWLVADTWSSPEDRAGGERG